MQAEKEKVSKNNPMKLGNFESMLAHVPPFDCSTEVI